MSRVLGWFRRLVSVSETVAQPPTAIKTFAGFSEGDRVLVNGSKLLPPLQTGQKTSVAQGLIAHDDIIGKTTSSFFLRTSQSAVYKIEHPSLDQYVALTPRRVTPIYASYASFIVSLLDIHLPQAQTASDSTRDVVPYQILEAGTGHGSLTLQLAKVISTANPTPPVDNIPNLPNSKAFDASTSRREGFSSVWLTWLQRRNAIVHTIDNVAANSIHAEKLIRGFRKGIYWPQIDFHIGDVGTWVQHKLRAEQASRDLEKGFLNAVVLDLPGAHKQLVNVCSALRHDAKLLIFAPSITQIGDCVKEIRNSGLPLALTRVVELGEGISNGRDWQVKLVMPKSESKSAAFIDAGEDELVKEGNASEETEDETTEQEGEKLIESEFQAVTGSPDPVMVCRPMVGKLTIGGGFVGLWKKVSVNPSEDEMQWQKSRRAASKSRRR